MERLLDLHTMLTGCTTELRQPINLEQQLLQTSGSDTEVAASMVQLLQVWNPHASLKHVFASILASKPGCPHI